jgi:hypothetical protein
VTAVRTVTGRHTWATVTPLLRGRGRRYAAVAYVSGAAPELLPLRRGDVLVVNAGPGALRARATDPVTLTTYVDRGVHVYSNPALHAKVIVLPELAVLGSANASRRAAENSVEAVVVLERRREVEALRAFVDELVGDELTEDVDEAFLDAARAIHAAAPPATPLAGVTDGAPAGDLIGPPPWRLHVSWTYDAPWTEAEERTYGTSRRRARRLARGWQTAAWSVANDIATRWREGDLVLQVHEDGLVHPPGVIVASDRVPRGRSTIVHYKAPNLDPIPRSEVEVRLRAEGLAGIGPERAARSERFVRAVLALWGLSGEE